MGLISSFPATTGNVFIAQGEFKGQITVVFGRRLHGWIYTTLAADPTGEAERFGEDEQLYVSTVAMERGAFANMPPDWIASFKHDCRQNPRIPVPATQIVRKRLRRPLPRPTERSQGGGGMPQDLEDLGEEKQA